MFTLLFNGGMVPSYMVIRSLGWVGNPMVTAHTGLYQCHVHHHDDECFQFSASGDVRGLRIDGAGHIRTMWRSCCRRLNLGPVIILNSVVGHWNSWFTGIHLCTKSEEALATAALG